MPVAEIRHISSRMIKDSDARLNSHDLGESIDSIMVLMTDLQVAFSGHIKFLDVVKMLAFSKVRDCHKGLISNRPDDSEVGFHSLVYLRLLDLKEVVPQDMRRVIREYEVHMEILFRVYILCCLKGVFICGGAVNQRNLATVFLYIIVLVVEKPQLNLASVPQIYKYSINDICITCNHHEIVPAFHPQSIYKTPRQLFILGLVQIVCKKMPSLELIFPFKQVQGLSITLRNMMMEVAKLLMGLKKDINSKGKANKQCQEQKIQE